MVSAAWQPAWLPLLRRTGRAYVALDRDATDRAIALAGTFGSRGCILIPRRSLVRKAISTTGCESVLGIAKNLECGQ
jgi:hypothetical protein